MPHIPHSAPTTALVAEGGKAAPCSLRVPSDSMKRDYPPHQARICEAGEGGGFTVSSPKTVAAGDQEYKTVQGQGRVCNTRECLK